MNSTHLKVNWPFGWAGGEKSLACISETVMCRKLIRGRDIGQGV